MMQLKNAGSLVEALNVLVRASAVSSADAQKLTALIQSGDEELGAPAGEVYESHSGDIVGTISDLLEKAETQLDKARNAEQKSLNDFQLLAQSLNDEISFAKKDMENTKKNLASSGEKKADAEGDLGATTKDLKEDNTALGQLHHDCMTKAQEFEAETKSRGEELAALAKAKAIIQEATSLSQMSFVQTKRSVSSSFEAVRFVRTLAEKQGSTALSQLASRLSSLSNVGSG